MIVGTVSKWGTLPRKVKVLEVYKGGGRIALCDDEGNLKNDLSIGVPVSNERYEEYSGVRSCVHVVGIKNDGTCVLDVEEAYVKFKYCPECGTKL